jgi:hypothetical protein
MTSGLSLRTDQKHLIGSWREIQSVTDRIEGLNLGAETASRPLNIDRSCTLRLHSLDESRARLLEETRTGTLPEKVLITFAEACEGLKIQVSETYESIIHTVQSTANFTGISDAEQQIGLRDSLEGVYMQSEQDLIHCIVDSVPAVSLQSRSKVSNTSFRENLFFLLTGFLL